MATGSGFDRMPKRPNILVLLSGIALLGASSADAKHIYQYTDAHGIVHFTDVKPPDSTSGVKSTLVHTDPHSLLRSREDGTDEDRTIVLVNESGGPITAEIEVEEANNVRSEPAVLPARVVVAGRTEVRALRVVATNPAAGFRYRYKYSAVFGDYRAQPDASVRYQLPFSIAKSDSSNPIRISQAFDGKFSHHDAGSRYAVDIMLPEGTPVLAARDGVVMSVDNDYYGNGLDMSEYGERANNVRIVHADGTMAIYAHLELESARVQVGDNVRAGQVLALSGDTGYSNGPHLHFCIQRNADMNLIAVPFQFTGPKGDFTPVEGMTFSTP
jgi:murein DD-endopeptidase MepM/ murein hydrolase activator NlpD